MIHLRKMMLDELQRRNYAQSTADAYVHALKEFAAYYHRPPDQLGLKEISQFQLYLLRERKLSARSVEQHIAALQSFSAKEDTTMARYMALWEVDTSRTPAVIEHQELKFFEHSLDGRISTSSSPQASFFVFILSTSHL